MTKGSRSVRSFSTFMAAFLAASLLATTALADSASGPDPVVTTSAPNSTLWEQSSQTTAVGKGLGGDFQAGVPENFQQVLANATLKILGFALQALEAVETPPDTINGVTYNEVFSFGKRVFSQSFYFTGGNGNLGFTVGLSPTEIRIPIVIYPVGPVRLEVDGGARFQADVTGQAVPNVAVPIQNSAVGVQLSALADAAGFIEGYASLLVVRAGVGGQVDLVDAHADVNARFMFDGSKPFVGFDAWVDFLSGRFYAFVDTFNILTFKFKRLLDYTLYSWKGYCFESEANLCSTGT